MPTLRSESYVALSGATVYAGRTAAPLIPAWSVGVSVNEVKALSGTVPSASGIDGYSGWAYNADAKQIIYGAVGGHSDGLDNSVNMLDLNQDTLSWVQLKAATSVGFFVDNASHFSNGDPNSRHTYAYSHWAPTYRGGSFVTLGCYAPATGSTAFNTCDSYSPSLGTWAPANSMDPCQGGHYGNARMGNGDVWALWSNTSRFWTEATATWSNPSVTYAGLFCRFPWAWDSNRNQLYGLCMWDGQGVGAGTDIRSVKMSGTVQTAIALSGSGFAQFQADTIANRGLYAGMTFDPVNDRFYWYAGHGSAAGRIYVITPNATNTWTIEILTTTGASIPVAHSNGINAKITWVDLGLVKGIFCMPAGRTNGCYFIRTT
jgi:hypothetical protein